MNPMAEARGFTEDTVMIPPPWESRLEMDVIMFRIFGANWRLLNRCRILARVARASGMLYGGLYWLRCGHGHYRYGEENDGRDF